MDVAEETREQLYARLGRQMTTIEGMQAEYARLRIEYGSLFTLVARIKSGEVSPIQIELSDDGNQSWILHPRPNLDELNGDTIPIPQNRLPPE